jgi:hypothetical protein
MQKVIRVSLRALAWQSPTLANVVTGDCFGHFIPSQRQWAF